MKQGQLFDDLPPIPALAERPVIPGAAKTLTPAQRRFNKLTRQVQGLREEIETLHQICQRALQRFQQECLPVYQRLDEARHGLVKALDRLLTENGPGKPRFSRKRRANLEDLVLWLAMQLGQTSDDPEIAAIRARYSPFTPEEEDELEHALVQTLFDEDALEGFPGGTLEEKLAYAQARSAEQPPPQSARAKRQAEKLAQAAEEAHHAVREVYRKLASQLHPDREKDDDKRRQKTAMMQRANAAYEKGDLLTLLNLQLECAQLDADALSELPEKRLERYNRALEEQVRTLQAQKQEYCDDLANLLELPPTLLAFSESFVDARLDTLVRERNSQQAELSSWSAGLSDPARRDAIIDSLLKEMAAAQQEMGFDALAAIFAGAIDEPAPARRSRKRKKR